MVAMLSSPSSSRASLWGGNTMTVSAVGAVQLERCRKVAQLPTTNDEIRRMLVVFPDETLVDLQSLCIRRR